MKRMMLIVALLSLLINCTYSLKQYNVYERGEIAILDERVGENIDEEERQRFDLFPRIRNFKEARFYTINEGGCEIIIVTDEVNFRIISRDPLTIDILGDYIKIYDEIAFSKKNFERKWRIVDYDTFGLPITQLEVNHIKRTKFRYICAGVGSVTLGAFCAYLLEGPGWAVLGGITGVIAGWQIFGSMIDQRNAIKAIKESRETAARARGSQYIVPIREE